MTSTTTKQNPVDLVKTILWDQLTKLAIAQILASLGIAAGPLGWLITQVVSFISDRIYAIATMMLDLGVIKLRNAVHQMEFDNASERLSIILSEYGPDSNEFKVEHEKERQSFYKIIAFNSDPLRITNS